MTSQDTDVLLSRETLTLGALPRHRNPYRVAAFGLLTLGLYWVWWVYAVNRELRAFDARIGGRPAVAAAALVLGAPFGVPQFLAIERTGQRIERAQAAAGLPRTCDPPTGVLMWLCFGVGVMYLQDELNKVVARYGAPPGTEVFHFA
jgi:membrane-associated phospholipid phosphatase